LSGWNGKISGRFPSSIIVAASYNKYFTAHPEDNDVENAVVIGEELTSLAEKNNVSVMSSPYDTSSTAMLIMYSVPVGAM
jgi:manganese-dependent inorganic pyrophosphatase